MQLFDIFPDDDNEEPVLPEQAKLVLENPYEQFMEDADKIMEQRVSVDHLLVVPAKK